MSSQDPSRRSVVTGSLVVAGGAVAGYLVTRNSDAVQATSAAAANGYGAAPGGDPVAQLEDVPDGSGLVLGERHVVLVRRGDSVSAHSATCTHQGCTVGPVTDGQVTCPCHGSVFDAATGDVLNGPATSPLPAVPVEVRDGAVYVTDEG